MSSHTERHIDSTLLKIKQWAKQSYALTQALLKESLFALLIYWIGYYILEIHEKHIVYFDVAKLSYLVFGSFFVFYYISLLCHRVNHYHKKDEIKDYTQNPIHWFLSFLFYCFIHLFFAGLGLSIYYLLSFNTETSFNMEIWGVFDQASYIIEYSYYWIVATMCFPPIAALFWQLFLFKNNLKGSIKQSYWYFINQNIFISIIFIVVIFLWDVINDISIIVACFNIIIIPYMIIFSCLMCQSIFEQDKHKKQTYK